MTSSPLQTHAAISLEIGGADGSIDGAPSLNGNEQGRLGSGSPDVELRGSTVALPPRSARGVRAASTHGENEFVLQTRATTRMSYRAFTRESYRKLLRREAAIKARLERQRQNDDGRLVNGEIVFDDEEDEDFLKIDSNPKLAEGQPLPDKFGRFPRGLYGKPVEEIDHYIKYKTFVVITKSSGRNKISRYSAESALFCLAPWNPLRMFVIRLINNQWFDFFILFVIVANCIQMALNPSILGSAQDAIENTFLVIYSLEFLLKMIARGFVLDKHTYLRDRWSYIDFGVVLISYLTLILSSLSIGNQNISVLKMLRALRVIRTLKGISVIPGLRTIVRTVFNSMGKLGEVLLLAFFIILVSSLISMQLYQGVFQQKCVDMRGFTTVNSSLVHEEYDLYINNASNWIQSNFDADWNYVLCGNESGAFHCYNLQNGSVCLQVGENPNWNFTHFDDFGFAMLTVFQIFTMDHWEDVYNKLFRLKGPWTIIYFFVLISIGSFYVINLILAVVRSSYTTEAAEEARITEEEAAEEAARARRNENTAMLFDASKLKERLSSRRQSASGSAHHPPSPLVGRDAWAAALPPEIVVDNSVPSRGSEAPSVSETGCEVYSTPASDDSHLRVAPDRAITNDGQEAARGSGGAGECRTVGGSGGQSQITTVIATEDLSAIDARQRRYLLQKFATLWLNRISSEDEQLIDRNCLCCGRLGCLQYHNMIKTQRFVSKVVTDGLFELFITLSIVANTAVMATQYAGMSEEHRKANEIANQVFTWIFVTEAVLKIISLSKEYFMAAWNIFDFVIAFFSLLDFTLTYVPVPRAAKKTIGYASRVVKIFRLMRIIKLAQSWSMLRSLLEIVFSTLRALVNVLLVLLLIMFLFAVLGGQLLGPGYSSYEYTEKTAGNTTLIYDYGGVMPTWNFKDFGHSLLVVFRILCGSWIEMCWDCMNVNDDATCPIVFVATLLVGQFLVLNLFIALLLDAFGGENIKKKAAVEEESKLKQSLHRISLCFKSCGSASTRPDSPKSSLSDKCSHTSSKPSLRKSSTPKLHRALRKANGHLGSSNSAEEKKPLDLLTVPERGQTAMPMYDHSSEHHSSCVTLPSHSVADFNKELKKECLAAQVTGLGVDVKELEIPGTVLNEVESAFQTRRHQYAQFEDAVVSSHLAGITLFNGPMITAEDFSENPDERKTIVLHRTTDFVDDSDNSSSSCDEDYGDVEGVAADAAAKAGEREREAANDYVTKMKDMEEKAMRADREEEAQISSSGEVILPDCCFATCYARCECCNNVSPTGWIKVRTLCIKISTNKIFEYFILVIIFLSSISLCFEDVHLDFEDDLANALDIANYVFTAIFVMEMLLKWCALGMKKYLTSFWTVLDGAIVIVSLSDIIASQLGQTQAAAFKSIRCLRGIRPLRAASRLEGMKIVINALAFAMPAIGHVLLVCLLFWLIFAILGVQLYAGNFYACYDPAQPKALIANNRTWLSESVYNVSDMHSCLDQNLTWRNAPVNFDNVANAYLALYQVATFEGWIEIMKSATSMPDETGLQPEADANTGYYVYFIAFVFIGSFFSLNLFIGVIIDNFNMLKKQYDGSYLSSLLTESQRKYYNTLKRLGSRKPRKTIRRPKARFLAFFFDIADHRKFEYVIMAVIILNMIFMIFDSPTASDEMSSVVKKFNTSFTAIFCVEAIIKLLGYRAHYFRRPWNVFDFIIVAISTTVEVFTYVEADFSLPISPTMLRITRLFRIGRVLRLIKSMKGIRKLLFTLFASLPGLLNIAVLLLLFMFIFSIVFMSLFLRVRIDQEVYGALSSSVNFQTFINSMCLLFRLITVAGWNDVLNSLMVQPPYCNNTHYQSANGSWVSGASGDCGYPLLAPVLLIVYLFLMNMIIVNMYIAVILESYENANEQEQVGIVEDDIDMFYNVWEAYDPMATQYVHVSQMSDFMNALEPPLRVAKPNGMALVIFNLPITEGERVHCLDVLMALVKRVLHNVEDGEPSLSAEQKEANEKLKQQIASKYKSAFPKRLTARVISTTMQRKKEDVAAKTLQRAWRRHRMQRNIMRIKELALEQTQKEAAEEDARSLKRRLSSAFGSARSRISSTVRCLSRTASLRSSRRSIDSSSPQNAEREASR